MPRRSHKNKKYSAELKMHSENSLHWVLDVDFGEDASRMRTANAAEKCRYCPTSGF